MGAPCNFNNYNPHTSIMRDKKGPKIVLRTYYYLLCGKSSLIFFSFHYREFPSVKDWHQLQCTLNNRGPLQNASIALSQVRPSEFLCSYETHCFALCMCCDFFACDCRMKCSEGCDCFHDQTWSSNIIECGRRGHARYLLFPK